MATDSNQHSSDFNIIRKSLGDILRDEGYSEKQIAENVSPPLAALARIEEQNESYRRIIDNVLLYLQRSQFLVGAETLIEDIQTALSNPAESHD